MSTGTCGAVLYRSEGFDVSLSFANPVRTPLARPKAAGGVYAKGELGPSIALGDVHDGLIGGEQTADAGHGVALSWVAPGPASPAVWTLTDAAAEGGAAGGTAAVGLAVAGVADIGDVTAFCRGFALWDDDLCFDCAGIAPGDRTRLGTAVSLGLGRTEALYYCSPTLHLNAIADLFGASISETTKHATEP